MRLTLLYDFPLGAFGLRAGSYIVDVKDGKAELLSATLSGMWLSEQANILSMIKSLEVLQDMKTRALVHAGAHKAQDAVCDWDRNDV